MKRKGPEGDMQHRRLRLRSASQGSAPAPAAQRHSTATKENQEHPTRVRTGNSVSPLDKTYHGGPQTTAHHVARQTLLYPERSKHFPVGWSRRSLNRHGCPSKRLLVICRKLSRSLREIAAGILRLLFHQQPPHRILLQLETYSGFHSAVSKCLPSPLFRAGAS